MRRFYSGQILPGGYRLTARDAYLLTKGIAQFGSYRSTFSTKKAPIRDKLLLTLRPYAYGEDVILDDIYGNLGEDVVVEWRERYGEDVPIVAYMIPEDMQAEMFAILGEGLWFDSNGIAKQVNNIELAQSPEINQWAVWYRLDAAAGLGHREVLFYHPDLVTVADVTKIAAWFKANISYVNAISFKGDYLIFNNQPVVWL